MPVETYRMKEVCGGSPDVKLTTIPGRHYTRIRICLVILASWMVLHEMSHVYVAPSVVSNSNSKQEEAIVIAYSEYSTTSIVSVSPTTAPFHQTSTTPKTHLLGVSSIVSETHAAVFSTSLDETCSLSPWTMNCTEWYNMGNWTVLQSPLDWNQTYSQSTMYWNTSKFISVGECQRVGTSLQWQSTTASDVVWDPKRFLQVLGPNKRITFVGDSVARQHYATFLEALGDTIENCSGFDHAWGARCPLFCQTTNNVTIYIVSDNYGSWDEGIGPWDGGSRGKSYNGTMATQDYFLQSDLIVMNFGLWYFEQYRTGLQTNHTNSTYIRHMQTLADDIVLHRQPHQLVVWRETTGPRKPNHNTVKAANRALRPYMAQSNIPVIYDHSAMPNRRTRSGSTQTTVADLYKDPIHFCEPALQMAWTSILFHIVQDWSTRRTSKYTTKST